MSGFKKKSRSWDCEKGKPAKLSWFQNITSRHILVLFEAKSSKQGSTVRPFTIMMQKV